MKRDMSHILEFELNCGHTIQLVKLEQELFYLRLIAGLPFRKRNKRYLETRLSDYRNRVAGNLLLIEPEATNLEHMLRKRHVELYKRKGIVAESFPSVISCGTFHSYVTSNPEDDYGELAVVWFQDAFGPDIPAKVVESIRKIDWLESSRGLIF